MIDQVGRTSLRGVEQDPVIRSLPWSEKGNLALLDLAQERALQTLEMIMLELFSTAELKTYLSYVPLGSLLGVLSGSMNPATMP